MMPLKFVQSLLLAATLLLLGAACEQTSTSSRSPNSAAKQTSSASWASKDAADHVGERGTICGPVVDTRYATGSNGKPTFLNFDRAYPDHTMVVVIWGSDRGAFPSNPQTYYKEKDVCATGLIESYKGKPEIVARDGDQLEIQR